MATLIVQVHARGRGVSCWDFDDHRNLRSGVCVLEMHIMHGMRPGQILSVGREGHTHGSGREYACGPPWQGAQSGKGHMSNADRSRGLPQSERSRVEGWCVKNTSAPCATKSSAPREASRCSVQSTPTDAIDPLATMSVREQLYRYRLTFQKPDDINCVTIPTIPNHSDDYAIRTQ